MRALVIALLVLSGQTLVATDVFAQILDRTRAQTGLSQYRNGLGSDPLRESYQATLGVAFANGSRIIGGAPVPKGSRPWQVALLHSWTASNLKAQFCGGSYLGSKFVVTAGHCVGKGTKKEQVDILLGTTDLTSGGIRVAVTAIVLEPGYNPSAGDGDNPKSFDHDIAILKVALTDAQSAQLGKSLTQISLVTAQQEATYLLPGRDVAVAGWGRTEAGDLVSPDLREVDLPIVDHATCNDVTGYDHALTDSMMCAGAYSGGADTCTGDSGGPLVLWFGQTAILGGVTSFGARGHCGDEGYYGVYTRVYPFIKWVNDVMRPH